MIWSIPFSPWGPYDGGDVFDAIIFSLPQLAAACAGGVFASLVTLITRRFFGVRTLDLGPEKGKRYTLGETARGPGYLSESTISRAVVKSDRRERPRVTRRGRLQSPGADRTCHFPKNLERSPTALYS